MKAKVITCGMIAGMVLLIHAGLAYGEEAAFRPGLSIGILASPSFNDYMSELDSDDDAAYAWLSATISVKIRLGDNWALVPSVDVNFNGNGDSWEDTDGDGWVSSESSKNWMIVPALNARYSFGERTGFYLQAGPNFVFIDGGGARAEFEGGGIGGGALLGYAFRVGIEAEIGYVYLPVDSTRRSNGDTTTENFGGPLLRVGFRF